MSPTLHTPSKISDSRSDLICNLVSVIPNFPAESGVSGLHREFLDITPLNINFMDESFKIN